MLRTATFLGKTGVLRTGEGFSGIYVNWARKLKAIRDRSTVDCCDPVTIPICEMPRERCMMDLLPVPCEPWQEVYDEENKKDTKVLLYSTGFFLFTLLCMKQVGPVRGYPEIGWTSG
ncbi:uncharacterized protein LOC107047811 [Diachasma alloeum]|uniref:uncharacterized protein LOC107047811 n=1 Tax=Diachasma alloeum TaxID=454923 RepID=UPI0007382203|nr:uncharacterized protein LOC107047811 [Diachasma alloeum]